MIYIYIPIYLPNVHVKIYDLVVKWSKSVNFKVVVESSQPDIGSLCPISSPLIFISVENSNHYHIGGLSIILSPDLGPIIYHSIDPNWGLYVVSKHRSMIRRNLA